MTYEKYTVDLLRRIRDETHENNILLKENNKMLKQLIAIENSRISHARRENEEDFYRNVLANIFSNQIDMFKRKIK